MTKNDKIIQKLKELDRKLSPQGKLSLFKKANAQLRELSIDVVELNKALKNEKQVEELEQKLANGFKEQS